MVRVGSSRDSKKPKKISVVKVLQWAIVGVLILYTVLHAHHKLADDHGVDDQDMEKSLGNVPPAARTDADITIAYAVSITGCGSDPLTEGAAVLQHSIHLASSKNSGGVGRYDYHMYAIYHPDAVACATPLAELGYTLLERPTPVAVADIQGDYLRERIVKNGCCGEKELIKLEAYTLVQHPVVVHLDLDVLILQPLDNLFDCMIKNSNEFINLVHRQNKNALVPKQIDAFVTKDYNMVGAGYKHPPVQGGFLVIRPSMEVYQEYVDIIRKGDYREKGGWGGAEVGRYYGGMTIQGIVPYFYDIVHPNTSVELNHCVYNQMCDNPRDQKTVNDVVHGKCKTGEQDCEDCRSRPLEEVVTTHFTLCQKPWLCLPQAEDKIQQRLCRKLHHEWYRIRSELEKSWGRLGFGPGGEKWPKEKEQFFGYCKSAGKGGYLPIEKPYGAVTSVA